MLGHVSTSLPACLPVKSDENKRPKLSALISGPKGREIEDCAKKCVTTCVRGGQGGPGLGPMAVR